MAARGAFQAFIAVTLAISSPAAAQVDDPGAEVADQQQRIDWIEATLASLESEARWEGDPCAKIYRGANQLRDIVFEELYREKFPREMVLAWRDRIVRLLKICPHEIGFIGGPQIFSPARPEQAGTAPPVTPGAGQVSHPGVPPPTTPGVDLGSSPGTAEWKAKQAASINRRLAYLESLPADRCAHVRAQAAVMLRVDLGPKYDFHFPAHLVREWRNRAQRLIVICDELEPPQQTAGAVAATSAGSKELVASWSSEIAAINNEFQRIEGLTDPREISSANEWLRARIARLYQSYSSRQGKALPRALMQSWSERSDRLTDRQRQLFEFERRRGRQTFDNSWGSAAAQPDGEPQPATPPPGVLNPLNIFSVGAQQQQQTQDNSGNPIIKGLNILGGGNRQSESDRNVQNRDDNQAAPANANRNKAKSRPKRDRARNRCDRNQGRVPAGCPNR